jgi:hypothetical protein
MIWSSLGIVFHCASSGDGHYVIRRLDSHNIWSSSGIIFILHPIIKDIEQLSTFCVQVHNLLKKWVWMQVEPFQTGGHPTLSWYTSPIYPYLELQWKFNILLFESGLSSKFGSRCKLNHPNRRRLLNILITNLSISGATVKILKFPF